MALEAKDKPNTWEKLIQRTSSHLGRIGKLLALGVDLTGLALGIAAFFNSDGEFSALWKIVLGIIVFNTFMWMAFAVYEFWISKRLRQCQQQKDSEVQKVSSEKESVIKQKESEIEALSSNLELSNRIREKYNYFIVFCNEMLTKYEGLIIEAETDYLEKCEEKENIGNRLDHQHKEEVVTQLERNAIAEYRNNLLRIYNEFLGEIFAVLKELLEMHLREKGIDRPVAICLKQFNTSIINNNSDLDSHYVISTFRDSETFHKKSREVGGRKYGIKQNSDFLYCLTQKCFIKNNIQKDDQTYINENHSYGEQYNCTVVVPVKFLFIDEELHYGYLASDTLNNNMEIQDVFDEKMADICYFASQIIGRFFYSFSNCTENINGADCLDLIPEIKLTINSCEE